jgi:hypothetical protein
MRTSGNSFLALYPGRQVAGVGSISQTEYPPPDKGPSPRNMKLNKIKTASDNNKNLVIKKKYYTPYGKTE